jgi:hypothetical protein
MPDTIAPPPQIKIRWFFGILGAFLIFVVIAQYSSRMAQDTSDYDQQRRAERIATLQKLRADDQKTLTTADWIDQAKGTVRIPIDEALPQTVAALKTKPLAEGAAIPGAAPAPSTVPAATGTAAVAGSKASTNAAPSAPTKPAVPNK